MSDWRHQARYDALSSWQKFLFMLNPAQWLLRWETERADKAEAELAKLELGAQP